MIVYSGTKSRFRQDVMTNDIGLSSATNIYAEDSAWQHEEIVLRSLNPAYADIVIPYAEAENFMGVAEVVGKCSIISLCLKMIFYGHQV